MCPRFERPIRVRGEFPGLQHGVMAGQHLVDIFKHAVPRHARRAEQQERAQAVLIQLRAHAGVAQQRLELGCKHQAVAHAAVKQRLDAEPVACERQGLGAFVPDGESVHAVELGQAARAPFHEGVQQHLGVRAPGKGVPAGI